MKYIACLVTLLAFLTVAFTATADSTLKPRHASTTTSSPDGFKPGCKLPFDAIKTDDLDIDEVCTADGNADNLAKRLESNAKNNFCAPGTPKPITYSILKRLQSASDDIDGLKNSLKTDRTVLSKILALPGGSIGEGKLVRFVAFILDAHFSNTGKRKPPKKEGELVNCNRRDENFNDIHIELVMSRSEDDPCNSVTAEMSPHFRPESWSELPELKIGRPVRITGPLFFDSSHQPCRGNKRPSPKRISVWEIHPVYQFEVCKNKSLASCKIGTNSVWIPLDQWHDPNDDDTGH